MKSIDCILLYFFDVKNVLFCIFSLQKKIFFFVEISISKPFCKIKWQKDILSLLLLSLFKSIFTFWSSISSFSFISLSFSSFSVLSPFIELLSWVVFSLFVLISLGFLMRFFCGLFFSSFGWFWIGSIFIVSNFWSCWFFSSSSSSSFSSSSFSSDSFSSFSFSSLLPYSSANESLR